MSSPISCFPYGPRIQCSCDVRGRTLHCLPLLELARGQEGEGASPWHPAPWTSGHLVEPGVVGAVGGGEPGRSAGTDRRTELILAVTLLVLVVLAFIG